MSHALAEIAPDWETAIENLITEDDTPVDNQFTEKQMRLLVEPLYSSWSPKNEESETDEKRKFIAAANVGIFTSPYSSAIVPDMFLSLDVALEGDLAEKENRSYFLWKYEKAPEVVVEIVSDNRGAELTDKFNRYKRMNVAYYVVFDPFQKLEEPFLRVYEHAFGWGYHRREDLLLPNVGLSFRMWRGVFEDSEDDWLRWHDLAGNLILTGKERADNEAERVIKAESEIEKLRAEIARLRQESN